MDALIQRARAGDEAAMAELLTRIAPAVQRFGRRMCGSAEDAEDALQDALLSVATHLGDFEGRSSFTSWVFALTRSACARRRRGLKNRPGTSHDDLPEHVAEGPSPEDAAHGRQLSAALESALAGMPEPYREVLLLRDVEGLTAPETADGLGISIDAVKSRLHRARAALRAALTPVLEPEAPPPRAGCPDVMAMWSRKLEDELDQTDCAQMERHLAACPTCAAACDALRTALGACRAARTEVAPDVQEQIRGALRSWAASHGAAPR